MEYADSLGFDPVVVECDTAVADYDGDGMAAIIEARLGTNPLLADSDGDGIDDYWEVVAGLDPLVGDAAEDPDGDGRTNLEEYLNSGYFYTNPFNPDTDGDGLCDGVTSVMDGATQLCGPGEGDSATPELDAARLRLLAESAIGELTLGDGDTWADELEEGDTLKLAVAGALDAGTYTVRFDNGSGSVYAIEVAVSEGATYIFVDTGDLGDEASGNFDIDVVDDSGSSLLDSGAASVNISRRLYLHYGLHSPVVATNSDGETVWRRAYLPFGADFAGSPSHPLTIANSSITHGFVGRRQDNDVGLYKLGARWYDPDLGRFVSTDPIPGLINQYEYAHNNPITFQDSNGMQYGGPGYTQWAENSSLSGGTVSVKEVVKELKTFADLSTAFVPGVNDVRDVFECTSGYDAINVTELQWYWRATSCVGIAAASGAGVRKAGLFISGVTRYGDDVASHADEAVDIAKKAKGVWSKDPLQRGKEIEEALAKTDYSDWHHIGKEGGGTFPLVDFQKGNNLVSVKSVDTTGSGWKSGMEGHIRQLGSGRGSVNDNPANMILDLRVQPGGSSDADYLVKFGEKYNVHVNIKEYP